MRECTTQDNHLSEDCPGTSSKVEECVLTDCIDENDPGTNTTAPSGQVKHKVISKSSFMQQKKYRNFLHFLSFFIFESGNILYK